MYQKFFRSNLFLLAGLMILLGIGCSKTGQGVQSEFAKGNDGQINATDAFPQPSGNENILLTTPLVGSQITPPFRVKGQARVFENVVSWRLLNSENTILVQGTTMAAAPDIGQFGDIDFWIAVPAVTDPNLTIEVYNASAKDGSDENVVRVPVRLMDTRTQTVNLFFLNDRMDPDVSCTKTFPVLRSIAVTPSPARTALLLLLQGPSEAERQEQYRSSLPFLTELKDLALKEDGTLVVDLKGAVEGPLGGSCLVGSISSEVTDTARQFSGVKTVEILVKGETNRLEP